ncbi:MAG: PD-(D/E)XK nuclease family protein [Oscillospiraceae bacterium]|nr:PD-(D/E)XK nuclease family protein [Oscillospiraceae bacterium]
MLNIVYTRAGQNGIRAMLERMGREGDKHCVLLVPDQYSHECERAMCRVLGNSASARCEVLSFTRLSRRLSDLCGGGAAPVLDAGGRMLLLYAALRQVSDSLKFYRTPSRKPAFLNSLLATLDECCSYGVEPGRLVELGAEQGDQQGQKWHDIGLILQTYLGLCEATAADPRQMPDRLLEQLKRSTWGRERGVFVCAFTDFTPQQEDILAELAAQGTVTLALVCDDDDRNGDAFELTLRTARRLKRRGKERGFGVCEERLEGYEKAEGSLRFMERSLFGPLPQPWKGECAVKRVKCADIRGETEFAAAEILRLVRQEGYRWRDIALCTSGLSRYEAVIKATFRRYGIPVYESAMNDVLRKPVLALVTSALSAVAQDYPYEELFRYLKTDLVGVSRDDRDRLENYVLTWNIRGGTWYRERDWDMHPEGYGKTFDDAQRAQVAELDSLRRRIIAPLERLRRNPDHTGRGRALAVYDFLQEIALEESLRQRVAVLEGRGQLNEAEQYRQLWDIVVNALEQCALYLEDTRLEAEEFSRLFALVLSQYDVGAIPVSLDRVTVSEAHRMAYKEVKVLFFLGTDHSAIPNCEPDPSLFSDRDRDRLAQFEIELSPKQEVKLRQEMTMAYETCAIPTQRLYLSYAALGADGQEREPCFLWERLEQLFPEEGVVLPGECRLAAPGPAMELAERSAEVKQALRSLPGYDERLDRLDRAAHWRRGGLSPEGVKALFGTSVGMSATRLDLFNSCHFGYFMEYGMKAKPRESAKFRPTEYGTFVHAVLETVLGRAKDHGGVAALAENGELRRTLALHAAEEYEREALSGLEGESARFCYLFERMKASAVAVADSVIEELAASDFEPVRFELGFGRGQTLPPVEVENGVKLSLSGFVDRVDEWLHEGKRYLRVVDYKTGKKSFDFSDVEDGRGLQMLLYLFALQRSSKQELGGEEIVPAGVLYVPARNPLVDGGRDMTPEEVSRAQQSMLRRRGLVLAEPEVLHAMEHAEEDYRFLPVGSGRGKNDYGVTRQQMEQLDGYITGALERAAGQMARGNVDADPYWHNDEQNACRWCKFRSACHFEECCGDRVRLRKAVSSGEFWQKIGGKEGQEHGGDQTDR